MCDISGSGPYHDFTNDLFLVEPPHDKNNKMACAPSEDSDQPDQSVPCPHEESLGP